MRACCSPRGCSGCKTSSVCLCHLLTLTFLFLPGVSALFTWGVIAENGTTHIAVVPGGWTEDQLEDPTTYLKVSLVNPHPQIVKVPFQLMAGISWLLAEASKCPGVDYMYDGELAKSEEGNDTLEVMEYEYDYDVESPR